MINQGLIIIFGVGEAKIQTVERLINYGKYLTNKYENTNQKRMSCNGG